MILEAIRKFGDNMMRGGLDGDFQLTLRNPFYFMLLAELLQKNMVRAGSNERKVRIKIFDRSSVWFEEGGKLSVDMSPKEIEVPESVCTEIIIPTAPGYCTVKPEKPLFNFDDNFDEKLIIKTDENGG